MDVDYAHVIIGITLQVMKIDYYYFLDDIGYKCIPNVIQWNSMKCNKISSYLNQLQQH